MNRVFATSTASQQLSSRAAWSAIAALLVTSVHHVYGAYVYNTPWRLHVVPVSALAAAAIVGSGLVLRRRTVGVIRKVAVAVFVAVTLIIPVLLIGLIEGGYNHVVKNALYFAGGSPALMRRLFPPPMYEMPNDAFFEITGMLQVLPAALAARYLSRPMREGGLVHADRVQPGTVVARRELFGIRGERIEIPEPNRLVHLQFRRFAGCPVCNLHLRSFVRRREEIAAAGIREVVVFHSTVDELLRYESDLPFAVIADPDRRLYTEFGVEASPRALLDPRAWLGVVRALLHSLGEIVRERQPVPPLSPEGGSFGLPADFLIADDGRVTACKYGVHANDQWSVDDLLQAAAPGTRERLTLGATSQRAHAGRWNQVPKQPEA